MRASLSQLCFELRISLSVVRRLLRTLKSDRESLSLSLQLGQRFAFPRLSTSHINNHKKRTTSTNSTTFMSQHYTISTTNFRGLILFALPGANGMCTLSHMVSTAPCNASSPCPWISGRGES